MDKENQTLDGETEDQSNYTLTLDDDPFVGKLIEETLGIKNFHFESLAEFKKAYKKLRPVGAFIDIHLSEDESGLDVVPSMRELWPSTAIIVITADEDQKAVAEALASGADDFIRKPINPHEILARLTTRIGDIEDKLGNRVLRFGDFTVDLKYKSINGPGGQMTLSSREIELLAELVRSNGVVIPKDILKRKLWGNVSVSDNALDRKIFEVRKALKEVSAEVELHSIYGVGMVLRKKSHSDDKVLMDDMENRIKLDTDKSVGAAP